MAHGESAWASGAGPGSWDLAVAAADSVDRRGRGGHAQLHAGLIATRCAGGFAWRAATASGRAQRRPIRAIAFADHSRGSANAVSGARLRRPEPRFSSVRWTPEPWSPTSFSACGDRISAPTRRRRGRSISRTHSKPLAGVNRGVGRKDGELRVWVLFLRHTENSRRGAGRASAASDPRRRRAPRAHLRAGADVSQQRARARTGRAPCSNLPCLSPSEVDARAYLINAESLGGETSFAISETPPLPRSTAQPPRRWPAAIESGLDWSARRRAGRRGEPPERGAADSRPYEIGGRAGPGLGSRPYGSRPYGVQDRTARRGRTGPGPYRITALRHRARMDREEDEQSRRCPPRSRSGWSEDVCGPVLRAARRSCSFGGRVVLDAERPRGHRHRACGRGTGRRGTWRSRRRTEPAGSTRRRSWKREPRESTRAGTSRGERHLRAQEARAGREGR